MENREWRLNLELHPPELLRKSGQQTEKKSNLCYKFSNLLLYPEACD